MKKPRWTVLAVAFTLAVSGCSSKATDTTVDELGVTITVPGNWTKTKRADGIALASGIDGVILRKEERTIKTIEEARSALIVGAKIREEKQLPTGGFFFHFDVDYGTKDKPMVLPHVEVLLPKPTFTVTCELQLQPSQDPGPIARACSSMRACAACASDHPSTSSAAFERSVTDICLAFDLTDIATKLGWRAMKFARRSDGPSDSILCEYRTPQHSEHKLVAQFIPGSIELDLVLGSRRTFSTLDLPDGRVWAKSEMGTWTAKVVFPSSGLTISTTLDGMVSPPGMMKLAAATLAIAKSLPADPSALMVRPPKP